MSILDKVTFVLVETSHPGNIGAAARAMKTMGLTRLALVKPLRFPCAEATARAAGADDLLHHAALPETVAEAVAGAQFVLGTTARSRHLEAPVMAPREAAAEIVAQSALGPCTVLFGPEKTGLCNDDLGRCQRTVRIPTGPDFQSLNLAMAVQVIAYELRLAALADAPAESERGARPASAEALAALNEHLMQSMIDVGYFDPERPKLLPQRISRMLAKADLEAAEVQILRGFLSAVQRGRGGGRPS